MLIVLLFLITKSICKNNAKILKNASAHNSPAPPVSCTLGNFRRMNTPWRLIWRDFSRPTILLVYNLPYAVFDASIFIIADSIIQPLNYPRNLYLALTLSWFASSSSSSSWSCTNHLSKRRFISSKKCVWVEILESSFRATNVAVYEFLKLDKIQFVPQTRMQAKTLFV